MNLNQWFNKGLTPEEYMDSLEYHKDNFLHIYDNFLLPEDEAKLAAIKEKNLRVLALAEVWCGHCMLCVPILLRLAEKTGMPVKFLPRGENLKLVDEYHTDGMRIISVIVFIDKKGNESAKWGLMLETIRKFVDEEKKKLPSKDADDYKEKFKEFEKVTSKEIAENRDIWEGTYESIVGELI